MRRLNDIEKAVKSQIEYYENNKDYAGNYLDGLGDTLQHDGRYSEAEIYKLLASDLTTSTDYSYNYDNAITAYPVGELEAIIETDLTEKEYKALNEKFSYPSKYHKGDITFYVCSGMNIRVYSDIVDSAGGVI